MGWTSVRAMAAAVYVSEVHRVLNGGDGEPAKLVLAKRIEQVVWIRVGSVGSESTARFSCPCSNPLQERNI
eukprot:1407601-Prymnesium_polylepis.1